jgi:hypothetical protein
MKIYQIRIVLKDFSPRIWRRVLVQSDLLLSDLHRVIQTSMGWTNSHLHQFIKNETFYTVRMKDDDFWEEMNNVDYKKMKISDLLEKEKDQIIYKYDFGDGWMHDITLEKILAPDNNIKYPVFLAGKMNCPPEDCGGVWGYSDILKVLKKPDHKEYESLIEWLGGKFDPEYFNIDKVNKSLRKKDYGVMGF